MACTATDFIDPYVGNWTQKFLGKRVPIGCGHDHSKDGGHDHHHDHGPGPKKKPCTNPAHKHTHDHAPKVKPALQSNLKYWWMGEVIGDFGAVPVTIAAQRMFPGAMKRLQHVMEPLLGGFFRRGAERSATSWALENKVRLDSPDFQQRANVIYKHEMEHLPQALMWTLSSIALNLTSQRLLGNCAPFWQLAAGKATGASISAALVVGGRGLMPGAAEKWDQFTGEKVFLPATRALSGVLGVRGEDVDAAAKGWAR